MVERREAIRNLSVSLFLTFLILLNSGKAAHVKIGRGFYRRCGVGFPQAAK